LQIVRKKGSADALAYDQYINIHKTKIGRHNAAAYFFLAKDRLFSETSRLFFL
jgi:hypothetical protein